MAHRHKAGSVDEGKLAVTALSQPVERLLFERLAHMLDAHPRRSRQHVKERGRGVVPFAVVGQGTRPTANVVRCQEKSGVVLEQPGGERVVWVAPAAQGEPK